MDIAPVYHTHTHTRALGSLPPRPPYLPARLLVMTTGSDYMT